MNQTVLDWLQEAPFSNPELIRLRPDFSYEDWFDRGRALPESIETLIELLEQEDLENPSGNGMRAAYALGWIGDARPRATAALTRCIGSVDNEVRFECVAALGRLRADGAVPMLEKLALDTNENTNVRANACMALGTIGAPSSGPVLERLARDRDSFVASCAVEGLKTLRGGGAQP